MTISRVLHLHKDKVDYISPNEQYAVCESFVYKFLNRPKVMPQRVRATIQTTPKKGYKFFWYNMGLWGPRKKEQVHSVYTWAQRCIYKLFKDYSHPYPYKVYYNFTPLCKHQRKHKLTPR